MFRNGRGKSTKNNIILSDGWLTPTLVAKPALTYVMPYLPALKNPNWKKKTSLKKTLRKKTAKRLNAKARLGTKMPMPSAEAVRDDVQNSKSKQTGGKNGHDKVSLK